MGHCHGNIVTRRFRQMKKLRKLVSASGRNPSTSQIYHTTLLVALSRSVTGKVAVGNYTRPGRPDPIASVMFLLNPHLIHPNPEGSLSTTTGCFATWRPSDPGISAAACVLLPPFGRIDEVAGLRDFRRPKLRSTDQRSASSWSRINTEVRLPPITLRQRTGDSGSSSCRPNARELSRGTRVSSRTGRKGIASCPSIVISSRRTQLLPWPAAP